MTTPSTSTRSVSAETVRDYYDAYADVQRDKGVNPRHHRILEWAMRAGLQPDHRVLEVGCGIGTFTSLLIERVPTGKVVAMDISPRSVLMAREWLGHYKNLEIIACDPLAPGASVGGPYDLIILPDVLEHIPLEAHEQLLRILSTALTPVGTILVHSPSAQYIEWLREHRPDLLQVIDLPIHLDELLMKARKAGLFAQQIDHYSLWTKNLDVLVVVLRNYAEQCDFVLEERAVGPFGRLRGWLRRVRSAKG